MMQALALPDGRRGQMLAVGITLIAVALVWCAVLSPVLGWYATREATLEEQRQLAVHMQALGRDIPALRQAVSEAGLQSADDQVLLPGGTDVIAGANLQSALQGLAAQAGTSLDSAALQPAQPAGGLQRISMQVSVTASWPVLMALFEAIGTARPRMIIDTLSLSTSDGTDPDQPVQASFTVTGFRAGSP
jgi:general secretion pathway protein M